MNWVDFAQILFIVLKLLHVISWPWYIVLLPLEIGVITAICYLWFTK